MKDTWVIAKCDPTLTPDDFEGEWAGDCWVPQQEVKGEFINVMPGFVFVPFDEWADFRRKAPRKYQVEVFESSSTGQPKVLPKVEFQKMVAVLQRTPMPNPMKKGETVLCHFGPWAGLGGELIKLVSIRTIRVKFGSEYATIPKVFCKRS